jgi:hypothetical protein
MGFGHGDCEDQDRKLKLRPWRDLAGPDQRTAAGVGHPFGHRSADRRATGMLLAPALPRGSKPRQGARRDLQPASACGRAPTDDDGHRRCPPGAGGKDPRSSCRAGNALRRERGGSLRRGGSAKCGARQATHLVERDQAASTLLRSHPEWSDRRIAELCGLSDKTVARARHRATADARQSSERVGRDGRRRPVDPATTRLRVGEYIALHPESSDRVVATATATSRATVRDVRQRIARGDSPLPPKAPSDYLDAAPRIEGW